MMGTGGPDSLVATNDVVPLQVELPSVQVQLVDPLKVFPDTVAVSEVMVVVPPWSG